MKENLFIYLAGWRDERTAEWTKKKAMLKKLLFAMEAEILPEMIEWGHLCITDLFQNKPVAYLNPK